VANAAIATTPRTVLAVAPTHTRNALARRGNDQEIH